MQSSPAVVGSSQRVCPASGQSSFPCRSNVYGVAHPSSRGHTDETEFMKRAVFGICLDGSDYERRCVSRAFLAHNSEKTVFLFARLHRVPLDYQDDSPCGS